MPATKVQLVGGRFQDSEGNPLASGYLRFFLNQDATITGIGSICSGIYVQVKLDANGSVAQAPPQYIWGNDQMSPTNSFYRVFAYASTGQLAWGPNNQQISGTGTFDLGAWTPNQVVSWVPALQPLLLKTDGVENGSQTIQNLVSGTNVTLTDDGDGDITIDVVGGGYSSGANVVAPLPVLANSSSGLNGYTVVMRIPASYVQAFNTTGIKVGVQTTGTTGLVLKAASIGLTAPGSTTWTTAPVAFTWPGGAFAVANTLYMSNACSISFDASHDIYVLIAWDAASSGGAVYATQSTAAATAGWAIYGTPNQLMGYVIGDHTADADASSVQSGGLGGTAIFCIQQVRTA